MRERMLALAEEGFPSFYYASHAAFLSAATDDEALAELRKILLDAGIPESRLESFSSDA